MQLREGGRGGAAWRGVATRWWLGRDGRDVRENVGGWLAGRRMPRASGTARRGGRWQINRACVREFENGRPRAGATTGNRLLLPVSGRTHARTWQ